MVPASKADEPAAPAPRSMFRSVAVPTEHGGWGLTLEPGLLGLLVAPSAAGVCLAAAAMVAFVARTPLKVVLVDRRRGRTLPRTRLARRVAAVELVVLAALVAGATVLAEPWFWLPAIVAAPLILVESWFDVRSREPPPRPRARRGGRRLFGGRDDRACRWRERSPRRGRMAGARRPGRDLDPSRPGADRPAPRSVVDARRVP